MSRLLTLVMVLAAGVALAKPKIAVTQFDGPKASKVKAQVSKLLCTKFTCVQPGKGSKKASVDAVVTGSISGKELELKVYTDPDSDPVTRTISLGSGAKVSKKAVPEMASAVKEAIKAADSDESDDAGGTQTAGL
ncbi:MAG: hypothetical protein QM723_19400 [Myxococcaceae bacterium]